jgi:hypothetical protein
MMIGGPMVINLIFCTCRYATRQASQNSEPSIMSWVLALSVNNHQTRDFYNYRPGIPTAGQKNSIDFAI